MMIKPGETIRLIGLSDFIRIEYEHQAPGEGLPPIYTNRAVPYTLVKQFKGDLLDVTIDELRRDWSRELDRAKGVVRR